MVKFAVISTQRTGSTLLIKLLDSHPEVLCAGEIFHPPSGDEHALNRYLEQSLGRKMEHQFVRGKLVREFLNKFYAQRGYEAIGFKFMYSQARHLPRSYPSVLPYLEANDIRIIHGVRRNKLSVLLSRILSRSSGVYRSTAAVESRLVQVPVDNLVAELSRLEEADNSWEQRLSVLPYIKVDYESLLSDREAQEQRLLGFIGVEYQGELTSPFRKLGSKSLRTVIENYDEVRRTLMPSEFAWCLDEEEEGANC